MSGELDLIRGFHAEDAVVDASSQNEARAALLEHIDGSTNSTPGKRSGWLRRPSRPVAVLVVALVIAGSAAAAVLSLSASQPLVGRVPGAITPASVAGYNYTIAVTPGPSLEGAGAAGWQSWIVYSRPGTSGYRGGVFGIAVLSNGHEPHLQRWRARQRRARRDGRVRPHRPAGVGRPGWEPDDPHRQFTQPAERRSSRRVLRPCQRTRPGVVDRPGCRRARIRRG